MIFGAVPLADALGAILAHSAELRGGRLRKGKVLTQTDLDRMAAEGWSDVIVARLADDDLGEDDAARALAAVLIAHPFANLRASDAATGRVNLHSQGRGILTFAPAMIHAVNAVNPLITVATLPPNKRVGPGDMVATIKIIAYGVPKADVARACAAAQSLMLASRQFSTATLIETRTGADPSPKGREAMATRLARLGVTLTDRVIVRHDANAVAQAMAAATGELVFLLTASATSDPGDVGPSAVRAAGGRIMRFGIPVDPGNLLFLGDLPGPVRHGKARAKPVVGLPGCARSLALNGADWVIERVICGVQITDQMINEMGVGGLLKEPPSRPHSREI